jgi:hypothetical protein
VLAIEALTHVGYITPSPPATSTREWGLTAAAYLDARAAAVYVLTVVRGYNAHARRAKAQYAANEQEEQKQDGYGDGHTTAHTAAHTATNTTANTAANAATATHAPPTKPPATTPTTPTHPPPLPVVPLRPLSDALAGLDDSLESLLDHAVMSLTHLYEASFLAESTVCGTGRWSFDAVLILSCIA